MLTWTDVDDARRDLRTALTVAMKARDAVSVSALRCALAAIDNAEAVDVDDALEVRSGAIVGGVHGLGAGEVPRRRLSVDDVELAIRAEVEVRRTSAAQFEHLGRPDEAAQMAAEAAVLEALVHGEQVAPNIR